MAGEWRGASVVVFKSARRKSRSLSGVFARQPASLAKRKRVGGGPRPTERASMAAGGDLSLQDLEPNKGQREGRGRGVNWTHPRTSSLGEEEEHLCHTEVDRPRTTRA